MERIDHSGCSHSSTTSARTACRTARRNDLRTAQRGYMDASEGTITWDEYTEMVCRVALRFNIEVHDAYPLIEESPIV
jgi:hypothetical protein